MLNKIIIIDDQISNLDFFQEVANHANIQADTFTDPHQALEAMQKNRYDAAFVDIEMPIMNGIELAIYIKAQQIQLKQKFPVYALSAHEKSEYPEIYSHFDDFIPRVEFQSWLQKHT